MDEALQSELLATARAARAAAYAPYSNYLVGAALLAEDGRIFGGCNVENAAYPQGVCAEGGALSMMISAGDRRVAEVLVIGEGELLCTPCGGCRQKLREFCGDPKTFVVMAANENGVQRRWTLEDLLPQSFGPDHLA